MSPYPPIPALGRYLQNWTIFPSGVFWLFLGIKDLFDPDGAADRHFLGPLSGRPEAVASVLFGVICIVFGIDPFLKFLGVSIVLG